MSELALHAEVVRILALPSVKTQFAAHGLETRVSASPAEFAELIRRDRERWGEGDQGRGDTRRLRE